MLSGQDLYVDGQVGAFAGPVAVEEQCGHQLVAVLAGVEGRAAEFVALPGICQASVVVGDFPEQSASRVEGQPLQGGAK